MVGDGWRAQDVTRDHLGLVGTRKLHQIGQTCRRIAFWPFRSVSANRFSVSSSQTSFQVSCSLSTQVFRRTDEFLVLISEREIVCLWARRLCVCLCTVGFNQYDHTDTHLLFTYQTCTDISVFICIKPILIHLFGLKRLEKCPF